jgi:F-box-like
VSFLSQNDVCSCAAVSSRWREAASADTIWQHFTNGALCGELGTAAGVPALIAAVFELLSTEYFEITQDLFGLARRTQDRGSAQHQLQQSLQPVDTRGSGDAAAAIYASCRSWRRFYSTYVFTDSCIINSLGSSCSNSTARTPSSSCGPVSSSSSSAAAAAAVVAQQAAVQLEAIRKAARQRQVPEAAKRAGCQLLQLYAATARSAAVAERQRASASASSSSSRGSNRGSIRFSSSSRSGSSSTSTSKGAAAAARSRLTHYLKRDVLPGAVLAVVAALYVDCCSVLLHEAQPAPSATVILSTATLPVSMLRLLKCYIQFYDRARLRVGLHGLKPSHGAQIVVVYDDDDKTDATDAAAGSSTAVSTTAATVDTSAHSEMISDSTDVADDAEIGEKQEQRSVTIGCSHGAVTEALQLVHSDPFHGPAPTVSAHTSAHFCHINKFV